MKKLLVNFFGGPGIGKTTAAAGLFVELKKRHIESELISEFPKDAVLEGRSQALKHQWYTTGTQAYRIDCAYKHHNLQVVITDSPVLLAPIYDTDSSRALLDLSFEHHNRYNNMNIVLTRNFEFEHTMVGRVHSHTESVSIDKRITALLDSLEVPYVTQEEIESAGYELVPELANQITQYLSEEE